MAYDMLLKGGTIVDGTGAKRYAADVAINDGLIVEIGKPDASGAKRVIDASGLVIAPGVIDVHTHYDAQLCWDGVLETSAAHGVTTVIQGGQSSVTALTGSTEEEQFDKAAHG